GDIDQHRTAGDDRAGRIANRPHRQADPYLTSVGSAHLNLFVADLLTGKKAVENLLGLRSPWWRIREQIQHWSPNQLVPCIPEQRHGAAVGLLDKAVDANRVVGVGSLFVEVAITFRTDAQRLRHPVALKLHSGPCAEKSEYRQVMGGKRRRLIVD